MSISYPPSPFKFAIDQFGGDFAFLSNFYSAPAMYDGVLYPTSEHAYQAAKSDDPAERLEFLELNHPAEAKHKGREIIHRDNWNEIKVEVMTEIVRDKFNRTPRLAQMLLATDDVELIEGNTWNDTFWGVCKGKGQNHLGKILMQVRSELKGEAVV